jgi:uncharacterized protein (TIGR03067 family)
VAELPADGLRMWRAREGAHSGEACLAIANTHQYEKEVCNNWAQELEDVPLGKTIRLSAYVKTAGADNVNLCIQCWDKSGQKMLAFASSPVLRGDHPWTLVSTTPVEVPPDTASIMVRAVLTGQGQVWFDDLSLVVVEEPEPAAIDPRLYGLWTGFEQGAEKIKWTALFCADKVILVSTSGEGRCGTGRTDATQTPHRIDLKSLCACTSAGPGGAEAWGIYKVEGSTLTLCFSRPGSPERPSDFGVAGSRTLVLTRQE